MEKRIRGLCETYLGWNGADNCIVVEKLGKGCSNEVLTATLLNSDSTQQDKVLVRMYGSNITSRLVEDIYINCHLGTLGRVPKIRGLFEGGRFEEFLPCTVISREEFAGKYEDMIKLIVQVHELDMPLVKQPCLGRMISDTMRRVEVEREKWSEEVFWYVRYLEVLGRNMTVTFCHNDFNMNNILLPLTSPRVGVEGESPATPTTLIDYEYSGYNYSLFDLANYCCEMQYDWSHDQPPYYIFNSDWFPGDDVMLNMIRHYKTISHHTQRGDEEMLEQLKFLVLGSELLWSLWALSYEGYSLDMQDYLRVKSESYFTKKRQFEKDIEKLVQSCTN